MKNQKLKTWLSTVSIIMIFIAFIIFMYAIITEDPLIEDPLFYVWKASIGSTSGQYNIDWNYASVFFVLLMVSLGSWATKMGMFTIPSVKEKSHNSSIILFCDVLGLVGLIFAIIALFLPTGFTINAEQYITDSEPIRITATRVLGLLGTPLAFISGIGTIAVAYKSEK